MNKKDIQDFLSEVFADEENTEEVKKSIKENKDEQSKPTKQKEDPKDSGVPAKVNGSDDDNSDDDVEDSAKKSIPTSTPANGTNTEEIGHAVAKSIEPLNKNIEALVKSNTELTKSINSFLGATNDQATKNITAQSLVTDKIVKSALESSLDDLKAKIDEVLKSAKSPKKDEVKKDDEDGDDIEASAKKSKDDKKDDKDKKADKVKKDDDEDEDDVEESAKKSADKVKKDDGDDEDDVEESAKKNADGKDCATPVDNDKANKPMSKSITALDDKEDKVEKSAKSEDIFAGVSRDNLAKNINNLQTDILNVQLAVKGEGSIQELETLKSIFKDTKKAKEKADVELYKGAYNKLNDFISSH